MKHTSIMKLMHNKYKSVWNYDTNKVITCFNKCDAICLTSEVNI